LESLVTWCIGLSIALYIGKECTLLYIARTKQCGILLESVTTEQYLNKTPPAIRLLDIVLTAFIVPTILLYVLFMYDKLSEAATIHELQVIDIGIVLLIYIIYPSRTVSHCITDSGLQRSGELTTWEHIYVVNMGNQSPVRRKTFVQFKARGGSIEGYIYERDVSGLRKLLAPHSIILVEVDRCWRD
jgi:hypothetical protein